MSGETSQNSEEVAREKVTFQISDKLFQQLSEFQEKMEKLDGDMDDDSGNQDVKKSPSIKETNSD
jgi:hypothetical protein